MRAFFLKENQALKFFSDCVSPYTFNVITHSKNFLFSFSPELRPSELTNAVKIVTKIDNDPFPNKPIIEKD